MITDRLHFLFTSKLTRMGKAISKYKEVQGVRKQKQRESYWVLKLKQNEILPPSRKRKPDNLVMKSCKKCVGFEEKVKIIESQLIDLKLKD